MKKGFTLIELLAVIVILAIIALIAMPTITGIVERTKKGGARESANGYIDAVNKQIALNQMDSDYDNDINEGVLDAPFENKYNVKVKGQNPKDGWVEVTKDGTNRYSLVIGEYVVTNNGEKVEVKKGNEPAEKPAGDTIIYRFSIDELHNGDKIDLKNRKYTKYYKFDLDTHKTTPINETHDMVGVYSTKLNDVLNISTNYNGENIENKSNQMYLKHKVNSEGIIVNTEACIKTSWGIFCLPTSYGVYDESTDKWTVPNFNMIERKMFDFLKIDPVTEKSAYDGVIVGQSSSDTGFAENSILIDFTNEGMVMTMDDRTKLGCFAIPANGTSFCEDFNKLN